MPRDNSQSIMKARKFVFVVDSYEMGRARKILERLGLIDEESYYITGAGGAGSVMLNNGDSRFVDSEKLLVFMSSFHGQIVPAITLSKEIKTVNPTAKIIFRSSMRPANDPIFDGEMSPEDFDQFTEVVRQFIESAK